MGRKRLMDMAALEKRIDAYFAACDALNAPEDGKKEDKKVKKPYALSGLLLAIGLTRAEFEKLYASPRYKPLLSRTLARIEAFTEENALAGTLSARAAANSLKYNFGWGSKALSEETPTARIRLVLDEEMMRLAE